MHTHGWIPIEELKNGYTQTDSMPTVKELRKQAKSYAYCSYWLVTGRALIYLQMIEAINHIKLGMTDTQLSWLRSYLESRTQFFNLGQHKSPAVGLDVGIAQGSILAPLLFAVYCSPAANDIVSHGVQFHQSADNTKLRLAMSSDNTS